MRVSYCVQHHPARADLLHRTAAARPEVVSDPAPEARRNPWRTYRECLRRTPFEATHRVVLQDDVELCPDFTLHVERALRHRPDHLVSLFVGTNCRGGSANLLSACQQDHAWCRLELREWVPVVALVWPQRLISPFLDWAERKGYSERKVRADDAIVGEFMRQRLEYTWATVPSLVEHPDDQESLIGMKNRIPRVATCYAGDGAAMIDWSRGLD